MGFGRDPSVKYEWNRWTLGMCLEYQESDEDLDSNPRFRLKDWNIKMQELRPGHRLLLPHHSPQHFKILVKILWNYLKPERTVEADQQLMKVVAVDHEGPSSSYFFY